MLRWSNPSLTNPEMISHSQGGTSQKLSDLVAKTSHGPLHKFKISFAIIFRFIILVQPILYLGNSDPSSKWLPHSISLHKDTKIHDCIYIYIRWLIKIPLSANGHSSRIKMLLSRNFRELHVYLSRGQCWATTPLMKIRSPPAKLCQRITDHFLIAFLNMQLASRNPFSGQIVADYIFLQGLLTPPFNMHFDFRPLLRRTFAELSRKYPYSQTPAHWRKSEHQGPWCLALAKPHFWKLGCCVWSLFLETSKIIIRQWQRQVQGCASGPWCLAVAKPHLWKLGCYLWRAKWFSKSTTTQGTEPEPNRNSPVPFSCRTSGGSGWQPFT